MRITNTGPNQTEITIDNLGTLLLSYDIPVAIVYQQPKTITTAYRCDDYYVSAKTGNYGMSKTTEKHIKRFFQRYIPVEIKETPFSNMERIAKFHGFNQ